MNNEEDKEVIVYDEDIKPDLSNLSNLKVYDAPMKHGRKDKGVRVQKDNTSLKSGRIMLGKQNVELDDGIYISVEEVTEALSQYLTNEKEQNKVIADKRTMERAEISNVIQSVLEVANSQVGKILLTSKSIDGRAKIQVKGSNESSYSHGGMLIYKKNEIQLANGEYIKLEEVEKALNDYMLGKIKKQKKAPHFDFSTPKLPKPDQPKPESNVHYYEKRTKRKYPYIIFLPVLLTATLQGCEPGKDNITFETKVYPTEAIAEIVETKETMTSQKLTGDDALLQNLKNKSIGDNLYLDSGNYYASSDYKYGGVNASGTFGSQLRPAGNYSISHVSIVNMSTGQIIEVQTALNENIANFIEQTLNKNNLKISDVEIMLHMDGPVSGWIDAREINNLQNIQIQVPQTTDIIQQVTEKDYNGTITFKNSDDEYVSIETDTSEGRLLPNGTKIIGSDGNEYTLNRISTTKKRDFIEKHTKEKGVPGKINIELADNIPEKIIGAAAVSAGMSVVYAELTKEQEKKEISLEAFEKKQKKWERHSKFGKIINFLSKATPSKLVGIEVKKTHIETTSEKTYMEVEENSKVGRK